MITQTTAMVGEEVIAIPVSIFLLLDNVIQCCYSMLIFNASSAVRAISAISTIRAVADH
jgi:hypothetical protein